MSTDYILAGVITLALLAYLTYSLLYPGKF
jgi:K+-transporting ATPase KdpF subunit